MAMTVTIMIFIIITTITIRAMRIHRLNSGAGKGQQGADVVSIGRAQGAHITAP